MEYPNKDITFTFLGVGVTHNLLNNALDPSHDKKPGIKWVHWALLAKLNITQARDIVWTWCKPDHLIVVRFRSYQVKEEVFWRDGRKKCFVMTFGSMLAINPFWGNATSTERKTIKVPQLVSKDLGLLEVQVFYRQTAITEPKYCRSDKGHGFLRILSWCGEDALCLKIWGDPAPAHLAGDREKVQVADQESDAAGDSKV